VSKMTNISLSHGLFCSGRRWMKGIVSQDSTSIFWGNWLSNTKLYNQAWVYHLTYNNRCTFVYKFIYTSWDHVTTLIYKVGIWWCKNIWIPILHIPDFIPTSNLLYLFCKELFPLRQATWYLVTIQNSQVATTLKFWADYGTNICYFHWTLTRSLNS
jgi:hypothetical protein